MSDLFSSLTMASRSLRAQQTGLDVVGQNMANVNTDSYTRRQLVLESVAPNDRWSAGGGVQVNTIRSIRDQLLERRLLLEQPAEGRESALADTLSVVESTLGTSGSSLDSDLTAFFDAWSDLAQDPTSSTARSAVLRQATSLATSFNDMATRLQDVRSQADDDVRKTVTDVNDLVGQIASLNDSIAKAGGDGIMAASLQDQQAEAVRSLSKLVDVSVIQNDTGGMDISFANGRPLVLGGSGYQIDVTSSSDGMAALSSGGFPVTNEISGGTLAGLIEARDVKIPGYLGQLDTIAYTLAQQVNAQHAKGYDLDGKAGGNVFVPLASASGAAAALQVDATLAANPRLLAASSSSAAEADNANARALANLRDAKLFGGGTGTFVDAWADLSYSVGQDAATAASAEQGCQELLTQIQSLRDAVSGVSLDEEAVMMLKFQRAYEANARFFATIDSAISTLINLVN